MAKQINLVRESRGRITNAISPYKLREMLTEALEGFCQSIAAVYGVTLTEEELSRVFDLFDERASGEKLESVTHMMSALSLSLYEVLDLPLDNEEYADFYTD